MFCVWFPHLVYLKVVEERRAQCPLPLLFSDLLLFSRTATFFGEAPAVNAWVGMEWIERRAGWLSLIFSAIES